MFLLDFQKKIDYFVLFQRKMNKCEILGCYYYKEVMNN